MFGSIYISLLASLTQLPYNQTLASGAAFPGSVWVIIHLRSARVTCDHHPDRPPDHPDDPVLVTSRQPVYPQAELIVIGLEKQQHSGKPQPAH